MTGSRRRSRRRLEVEQSQWAPSAEGEPPIEGPPDLEPSRFLTWRALGAGALAVAIVAGTFVLGRLSAEKPEQTTPVPDTLTGATLVALRIQNQLNFGDRTVRDITVSPQCAYIKGEPPAQGIDAFIELSPHYAGRVVMGDDGVAAVYVFGIAPPDDVYYPGRPAGVEVDTFGGNFLNVLTRPDSTTGAIRIDGDTPNFYPADLNTLQGESYSATFCPEPHLTLQASSPYDSQTTATTS